MLYIKESAFDQLMRYLSEILYGTIARILNLFVPVKRKHWIFGADYGRSYRESSKYMLEYMIKNHPDYKCFFVADTEDLMADLKSKGIPCILNNSLSGVFKIVCSDAVFCCQNMNDIRYAFKKHGRTYYYMTHGLPYKVCRQALNEKRKYVPTLKSRILSILGHCFCVNYGMEDSSFVPATSDFLAPHLTHVIGSGIPVKIIGAPRNDRFFNAEAMANERWIDEAKGKRVVTYMPTHRQYGQGEVTPTPFADNMKVQQWFRDNNVLFLMKQHPNMITKLDNPFNNDVIKDITRMWLDPQVVMYHSDILISDYSSAPLDFLIFRRPTIYYFYDNYEEVEGALYDVKPDFPNTICYTEDELFECIKKSVETPAQMSPSAEIVAKYHKYTDDKSSERYFKEVTKEKYGL